MKGIDVTITNINSVWFISRLGIGKIRPNENRKLVFFRRENVKKCLEAIIKPLFFLDLPKYKNIN